jgi:EH_Signature domain
MSLNDRVQELRNARSLIRRARLRTNLKIERSLEALNHRFDEASVVAPPDYAAVLAKVRATAARGSLSGLTLRDLRLTAACLFAGDKSAADDPVFLRWFLHAIRTHRSRLSTKRVILSYLLHFDPRRPAIRTIGTFLRETVGSFQPGPRWPWPALQHEYALFDPAEAPDRLANMALGSADPRGRLATSGLKGQAAGGGLSSHVFLRALNLIRERLASQPAVQDVDHAMSWVRGSDGTRYYTAQRSDLANALLLPWTDRRPPDDVRTKIQTSLLDTLSDPRIDGGAWLGTDDAARHVMIRWLAEATLEQFLKVVDRVAPKNQWEFRRAFWTAYIEKGLVANAWVAFGSAGAQVAARLGRSDGVMRRFGKLSGAGTDQAVLLLSIGDLIVADWSHNGRLRIWRRTNRDAPTFNLDSYAASSLRSRSDFDTVHIPADGWQAKAETYIRRHTRIAMNESEYMPRKP